MLICIGMFCLTVVGAIAFCIGAVERTFAPARTSLWFWPCALLGVLADLFVGLMVGLIAAISFKMLIFVNPGQPVAEQFFLPDEIRVTAWWVGTIFSALGYRWLRKHWAAPSGRFLAISALCIVLAVVAHFVGIAHGGASQGMPGEPLPPATAWFAWFGERHYRAGLYWFAPRFLSSPHGDLLSSFLGFGVPFMLSFGALLGLFMAVERGRPGMAALAEGHAVSPEAIEPITREQGSA